MAYDFLINLPAIEDFDDVSDIRVVIYQHGRFAHAPLIKLVNMILDQTREGGFMLLSGDEQTTGHDRIIYSGDVSGAMLLN